MHLVLITEITMSSIQIFGFKRYSKSERTEYGENNGFSLPIRDELTNLAFRATDIRRKEGSVDERFAEWKVRLTTSREGNMVDAEYDYLPTKRCDNVTNFDHFAPGRPGQKNITKSHYTSEK